MSGSFLNTAPARGLWPRALRTFGSAWYVCNNWFVRSMCPWYEASISRESPLEFVRLAMRGLWVRAAVRRVESPVRAALKRRSARVRASGGRDDWVGSGGWSMVGSCDQKGDV